MKSIIHKKDTKNHNMKIRTPLAPVGDNLCWLWKRFYFLVCKEEIQTLGREQNDEAYRLRALLMVRPTNRSTLERIGGPSFLFNTLTVQSVAGFCDR